MGIGERLEFARNRVGLTLAQVHVRTGVGQSSLSEFENSRREPSLSQLQNLSKLYRRSVAFFLAEGPIPQEDVVLWRQRPDAGPEDIESKFLKLCEQYHNLEVWTGRTIPVCLPEANSSMDTMTYKYEHAECLAKEVRNTLNLGDRPALSLPAVLEEVCGVKIFYVDFEPTGTAASAYSKTLGAGILLNRRNKRWRRNFDLAHELFHLLTWNIFRQNVAPNITSTCASEQEEKFATCFARNLLMPADAIRVAIHSKVKEGRITYSALFDAARQFDVSTEALIWHMWFVGLLQNTEEDTKAMIDQAKALTPVLEERDDTLPPLWPERYRALAIQAFRRGMISTGRFAEYLNISRQEAMRYVEQEFKEDEEVSVAPA